jgi:hypothetical protein
MHFVKPTHTPGDHACGDGDGEDVSTRTAAESGASSTSLAQPPSAAATGAKDKMNANRDGDACLWFMGSDLFLARGILTSSLATRC